MQTNYQIQQFTNQLFGNVRVLNINDDPWFVGNDVASCLGYERPRKAIADHIDIIDKRVAPIWDPLGGTQNTTIINESGLYSLIFSSKLPAAKEFKHWVTSEVLPTMRQLGFNAALELMQNQVRFYQQSALDSGLRSAALAEEKAEIVEKVLASNSLSEDEKQHIIRSDSF